MRKVAFVILVVCLLFSANAFAGDYVFGFKGNKVPDGFASAVAAQNGTLVYSHPVLAFVRDLSPEGAAAIGGIRCAPARAIPIWQSSSRRRGREGPIAARSSDSSFTIARRCTKSRDCGAIRTAKCTLEEDNGGH